MSNIYKLLAQSASAIDEVASHVRAGADVNSRSMHVSQRTVLEMVAAQSAAQYSGLIERLALLGADVNSAHPKSGATPLHLAAQYAPVAVVRRLCELGANVNALDREGRSPAFLTLQRSGTLAVEMGSALATLLAAGADPHVRDAKGVSLLQATRDPNLKNLIRAAATESKIEGAVAKAMGAEDGNDAPTTPSSRIGMQPL